jgi:hypothetical protein
VPVWGDGTLFDPLRALAEEEKDRRRSNFFSAVSGARVLPGRAEVDHPVQAKLGKGIDSPDRSTTAEIASGELQMELYRSGPAPPRRRVLQIERDRVTDPDRLPCVAVDFAGRFTRSNAR